MTRPRHVNRTAAVLTSLALSGLCYAASLTGKVAVDGSSTVFPITEAAASAFREVEPAVRVTVGVSGTGGGFKKFTAGNLDISDASRPIKPEEELTARQNSIQYIELPVAFDGLTVVINPANDWCKDLSISELKKIFVLAQGESVSRVKTWNDIRPEWPNIPLKLYIPGTDSGTFDYFKEVTVEKGQSIRSDVSASEDDNLLVTGVAGDKGALGFFGVAYYLENEDKVKAVAIDGGKGPVAPTARTIEDGTYSPLARPLFIYVNAHSSKRPEVNAFVRFYLENAADLAERVGYVPLPAAIYERAKANYAARRTGTQFAGAKGKIEEIYR